jgi:hypothetical protein
VTSATCASTLSESSGCDRLPSSNGTSARGTGELGGMAVVWGAYLENQNPPPDQCACWIPVAPGAPSNLAKMRRFGSRKTNRYQSLTSSVLNPRSPEVWRKTAGETELRVSAGASQSGGLRAKARVYWGFLRARKAAEKVGSGQIGGGRRTGIQHSPAGASFDLTSGPRVIGIPAPRFPPGG